MRVILSAIVLVSCLVWAQAQDSAYLPAREEGPEIPSQDDPFAFVPQGIWGLEDGRFVVSGYQYFGQPSDRQLGMVGPTGLWVIGGESPHLVLLTHKGQPLISHAGGIAMREQYIYIASGRDGAVYRGLWDADAATLAVEQVVTNPVPSSFLTVDEREGLLWVGQFYNGSSNYLDEWRRGRHHWRAVVIAYDTQTYEPQKAIAIRRKGQGMVLANGHMALSLSYGQRSDSTLAVYPDPRLQEAQERLALPSGQEIPLYLPLGRIAEHTLPPMAEEIWWDGEKGVLWMAYESAAQRRFPRVRAHHRQSHIQGYLLPQFSQP
ncbi:MAG: hypothetical protein EA401_00240 [Planctomycetota bacterium]|nr:MAG: hypothetical protein EA401_00240 [Planctomycetota bacterium]